MTTKKTNSIDIARSDQRLGIGWDWVFTCKTCGWWAEKTLPAGQTEDDLTREAASLFAGHGQEECGSRRRTAEAARRQEIAEQAKATSIIFDGDQFTATLPDGSTLKGEVEEFTQGGGPRWGVVPAEAQTWGQDWDRMGAAAEAHGLGRSREGAVRQAIRTILDRAPASPEGR
jgi:hypothetical protein